MTHLVLSNVPLDEFKLIISEAVREELSHLQVSQSDEKKYFTRKETAELLHISLPTLNERTKNGEIEGARIGNRVLYTNEAIENALKSTKLKKGGRL